MIKAKPRLKVNKTKEPVENLEQHLCIQKSGAKRLI